MPKPKPMSLLGAGGCEAWAPTPPRSIPPSPEGPAFEEPPSISSRSKRPPTAIYGYAGVAGYAYAGSSTISMADLTFSFFAFLASFFGFSVCFSSSELLSGAACLGAAFLVLRSLGAGSGALTSSTPAAAASFLSYFDYCSRHSSAVLW